jgi:hypothetical protein
MEFHPESFGPPSDLLRACCFPFGGAVPTFLTLVEQQATIFWPAVLDRLRELLFFMKGLHHGCD